MDLGNAAGHAQGSRFFEAEPDGFAVLGGQDMTVEYADSALRRMLPDLSGPLARSTSEVGRRLCDASGQVLQTGTALLIKGLPSATGDETVDLLLRRIDADQGRRVLALARIGPAPEPVVVLAPEHVPPLVPWPTAAPAREPPAAEIGPKPEAGPAPEPEPEEPGPERRELEEPGPERLEPEGAKPQGPEPERLEPGAPEPEKPEPEPRPEEARPSLDTVLDAIGIELQTEGDPERGLEEALRIAAQALACTTASLTLRRNHSSVVEAVYGLPPEYRGMRLREEQAGPAQHISEPGHVIAIEDALRDDRIRPDAMRDYHILAVLAAPLIACGERLGVVYFTWDQPQVFTIEQRTFATRLATLLSPCAQSLRLSRHLNRQATHLSALSDVLKAVAAPGMPSSVSAAVLEVLHDRLDLDYGDVRVGRDPMSMKMLASLLGHEVVPGTGGLDLGTQAAIEHRVITGRTEEVPRPPEIEGVRHISVPLDLGPDMCGVLDLSFLGSRRFTPDEIELFAGLGRALSLALAPRLPGDPEITGEPWVAGPAGPFS